MYNSIKNLDIIVFDRNIEMHYVYIQDVINEFVSKLEINDAKETYFEVESIFDTTLGEVVDFINEFKLNILNENWKNSGFLDKKHETRVVNRVCREFCEACLHLTAVLLRRANCWGRRGLDQVGGRGQGAPGRQ